jgi:hypothetical protein
MAKCQKIQKKESKSVTPKKMKHLYYLVPVAIGLMLPGLFLLNSCSEPEREIEARAAIVDQLYDVEPNPVFIDETTETLNRCGLSVDLYQGDEITVDFYRRLPTYGYRLIIFRVHSGLLIKEEEMREGTWLFTNESYNRMKHVNERLAGRVVKARTAENKPWVFAVGADFIKQTAEGQFDNAIIMTMGCYCLYVDDLAQAFIDKGASVYLGWNGNVLLGYVDEAAATLIQNLCKENLAVEQAVRNTMAELGPDPDWNTWLDFYPSESGDKTFGELTR